MIGQNNIECRNLKIKSHYVYEELKFDIYMRQYNVEIEKLL